MAESAPSDNSDSNGKASSKKLLQSLNKHDTLAALSNGIAHDFNNLLTPINGYLELLRAELNGSKSAGTYLENISTCVARAEILVNQIVLFNRSASDVPSDILVHLVLEEAITLLRASLPSTIEICERLDRKLPPVYGKADELRQMIVTLGTNAALAMPAGGSLEISLRGEDVSSADWDLPEGKYIRLDFKDTRVSALTNGTREQLSVIELGLSLAHESAQRHGGLVSAVSCPGSGTTFSLLLPEKPEESIYDGEPPRGQERILFVDDEYMIGVMTKEMLKAQGYDVEIRMDSREALQRFRETPTAFDVVVTDQTMPGMIGVELATELKKIREDIPVILCSGFRLDPVELKSAGVDRVVKKPMSTTGLLYVLREVLDAT